MLDVLDQLGMFNPWLWRGWCYLASPTYRALRHHAWRRHGRGYAIANVLLSVTVMALEIGVLAMIAVAMVTSFIA